MDDYGYYDIVYSDQDDRTKEHIVEQVSLINEAQAKRIAKSWQSNTWVEGRRYFYRPSMMPSMMPRKETAA